MIFLCLYFFYGKMKTIVVLPHRLSGRLKKKYMQSSFQIEITQLGLAAVIIITIILIIYSSSYRWRWEILEWTIFLDTPKAPCASPGLSYLVLLCLQFQFPFPWKPMAFSPEYILTHSTSFIVDLLNVLFSLFFIEQWVVFWTELPRKC